MCSTVCGRRHRSFSASLGTYGPGRGPHISAPHPNKRSYSIGTKPDALDQNSGKHLSGTCLTVGGTRKRHGSFGAREGGGGGGGIGQFKRRKKDGIIPPTKFLLGGNINDPLNLNGLFEDHTVQRTPVTSPLPTPKHHGEVQVFIPPNINDPLNLNAGEEDVELNLISPKLKKRKRKKRKKHSSGEMIIKSEDSKDVATGSKSGTDDVTVAGAQSDSLSIVELHGVQPSTEAEVKSEIIVVPSDSVVMSTKKKHRGRTSTDENESSCKHRGVSAEHQNTDDRNRAVPIHSNRNRKHHARHFRFNKRNEQFQYGNYNRYYGYRNPSGSDYRLTCLRQEWFKGKDILDIGCNVGHFTLSIAKDFSPKKIIGLDIDEKLVKVAKRNVAHYLKSGDNKSSFPISLAICHGPITSAALLNGSNGGEECAVFPNNVFFLQGNYVLDSDDLLDSQTPTFDVIVCLSLTKWVHLNWGDEGLKRTFKRIFRHLRPGGKLILEAQAWQSYKKKKMTESMFANYQKIVLRPQNFTEYLLSKEIGFSTCEVIATPFNASKGFQRPIQLFTKAHSSPSNSPPVSSK